MDPRQPMPGHLQPHNSMQLQQNLHPSPGSSKNPKNGRSFNQQPTRQLQYMPPGRMLPRTVATVSPVGSNHCIPADHMMQQRPENYLPDSMLGQGLPKYDDAIVAGTPGVGTCFYDGTSGQGQLSGPMPPSGLMPPYQAGLSPGVTNMQPTRFPQHPSHSSFTQGQAPLFGQAVTSQQLSLSQCGPNRQLPQSVLMSSGAPPLRTGSNQFQGDAMQPLMTDAMTDRVMDVRNVTGTVMLPSGSYPGPQVPSNAGVPASGFQSGYPHRGRTDTNVRSITRPLMDPCDQAPVPPDYTPIPGNDGVSTASPMQARFNSELQPGHLQQLGPRAVGPSTQQHPSSNVPVRMNAGPVPPTVCSLCLKELSLQSIEKLDRSVDPTSTGPVTKSDAGTTAAPRQQMPPVQCEAGCRAWYHLTCSGLSPDAYYLLKAEPLAEWLCTPCANRVYPNVPYIKLKG